MNVAWLLAVKLLPEILRKKEQVRMTCCVGFGGSTDEQGESLLLLLIDWLLHTMDYITFLLGND